MISAVGTSGSGKTTTIEYLTRHLTRLGFRVGVAKHIHREGFTIDTEGKDTWRHARAGADVVVGVSPSELAVIKKTTSETKFEDVAETLRIQHIDVALLEGFSTALAKRARLYKIISAKNEHDLKYTLAKTPPPILAITGSVARSNPGIPKPPAPVLDIPKDGPMLTSIVRRVLRPRELEQMLSKASLRHGEACIGLAIGVRAAYLTSSALGRNPCPPGSITCGTKHCIADAFRMTYPKTHVRITKIKNDQITIRSRGAKLVIQLTPKKKFMSPRQVLRVPEKQLFESASLLDDHLSKFYEPQ